MEWVEVRDLSFIVVYVLPRKKSKAPKTDNQQILVSRHFGERHSGAVILNEESKSKLALTNGVGQQYRASATLSSYMRPLCRIVKVYYFCPITLYRGC